MLKINSKDAQRAIVGVITNQGNLTVNEIAKRVGLRPHMVRYHLDQLINSKRVTLARDVNYRVFGYQEVNIFFNLPRASTRRSIDFLRQRSEVTWLAQNIGPQKFEITFFSRDNLEYSHLLQTFGSEAGVHFRDPVATCELEVRYWGLRFLAENHKNTPTICFKYPAEIRELDNVDKKILKVLRQSQEAPIGAIARTVGIALSTATYRIERLRDWGALSQDIFVSSVDQEFVQAQLVINLKVRTPEYEDAIVETCANEPYVEGLITGLGCWDYKIVLRADTVNRLIEVEASLLQAIGKNVAKSAMYIRNRLLL